MLGAGRSSPAGGNQATNTATVHMASTGLTAAANHVECHWGGVVTFRYRAKLFAANPSNQTLDRDSETECARKSQLSISEAHWPTPKLQDAGFDFLGK